MANIMTFRAQLNAFAEKIKASPAIVQKKVVLDLWASITRRTPVYSGRARANWFISEGSPTTRLDPYPGAKKDEVPAPPTPDVSGLTGTTSVFIINNLPYIEALENGHSKQAPNGMVRLAIQAAELRIQNAIKEP